MWIQRGWLLLPPNLSTLRPWRFQPYFIWPFSDGDQQKLQGRVQKQVVFSPHHFIKTLGLHLQIEVSTVYWHCSEIEWLWWCCDFTRLSPLNTFSMSANKTLCQYKFGLIMASYERLCCYSSLGGLFHKESSISVYLDAQKEKPQNYRPEMDSFISYKIQVIIKYK